LDTTHSSNEAASASQARTADAQSFMCRNTQPLLTQNQSPQILIRIQEEKSTEKRIPS
jgi:hypothetical protein